MIQEGDDLTPIVIKVGVVLILLIIVLTIINPPGNPFDVLAYIEEVERTGNCYNELYAELNDHELNIALDELERVNIYCTRK